MDYFINVLCVKVSSSDQLLWCIRLCLKVTVETRGNFLEYTLA